MKSFHKFYFAVFLFVCSCNNPQKKDGSIDAAPTSTPAEAIAANKPAEAMEKECYTSDNGKDIIQLDLVMNQDVVEGNLIYQLKEKDKNTGTIKGMMKGDTLLADYTFISEGRSSVREVIFLKTADGFKEGYAPVQEKEGEMVFVDTRKADFSKSTVLKKITCN